MMPSRKIAGLKLRRQRQRIFEVEDEVMVKRDDLIAVERRMAQKTTVESLKANTPEGDISVLPNRRSDAKHPD